MKPKIKMKKIRRACGCRMKVMYFADDEATLIKRYRSTACDDCDKKGFSDVRLGSLQPTRTPSYAGFHGFIHGDGTANAFGWDVADEEPEEQLPEDFDPDDLDLEDLLDE